MADGREHSGRRNVHWHPEASIRLSIFVCSTETGLGCAPWNKGCGVLCGGEKEHDSPPVAHNSFQCGSDGRWRGGPHEKYGVDAVEARIVESAGGQMGENLLSRAPR